MEKEEIVKFYTKMNKIRGEVLAADWEKDKFLSFGSKGYHYLSVDKMKRNIAPILLANGMELSVRFHDLEQRQEIGSMSQHWTVMLDATLVDMDTGFEKTYHVYGESGDSGDKGVSKAQTAAMKQFLSNTFMLIDGIEPDADDAQASTGKTFLNDPKVISEVKSKVLSNAVKPTPETPRPQPPAPAPKPTPAVKPTPAPPVKEVQKTDAPVDDAPVDDTPVEEPKPVSTFDVSTLPVTKPQANSIANIVTVRTQWVEEGKMTKEDFDAMKKDFGQISDTSTAMAFIKRYRVRTNE